jgi:hypothetical protein
LSLGDLREHTFLPTSLFLLPIYFKQALDLLTAFGGRRLFVRRCPIKKSARVGNLFATGPMMLRDVADSIEQSMGYRMVRQSSKSDVSPRSYTSWEI